MTFAYPHWNTYFSNGRHGGPICCLFITFTIQINSIECENAYTKVERDRK